MNDEARVSLTQPGSRRLEATFQEASHKKPIVILSSPFVSARFHLALDRHVLKPDNCDLPPKRPARILLPLPALTSRGQRN